MATGNKVPWRDLLSELRDRDKRWGKLLGAKFDPLRDEIRQMENQLTQICELSADNETRIGKLETEVMIGKEVRANCKKNKQTQAELKVKRWHVWAVIIAAGIAATAAVVAAVL